MKQSAFQDKPLKPILHIFLDQHVQVNIGMLLINFSDLDIILKLIATFCAIAYTAPKIWKEHVAPMINKKKDDGITRDSE